MNNPKYEYQRSRRYFAQIAGGLEELGVDELSDLGAQDVTPAYRGLYFTGAPEIDADALTLGVTYSF
jgi:putative N6-adenine-specific DNA methylase